MHSRFSHTHTQTDIYICINIKLAERALTHARTHTDTCKQKLFGNLTCSCAVTINAAAVNSLRATGTRATSSRGNSHTHTHTHMHMKIFLALCVYVCERVNLPFACRVIFALPTRRFIYLNNLLLTKKMYRETRTLTHTHTQIYVYKQRNE